MEQFRLGHLVSGIVELPAPQPKPDALVSSYLGDGVAMTRCYTGHILKVSAGDMVVTPHLLSLGFNEPHVTRLYTSLIKPGDVVVDAGANNGYFSVLGAWRAWPNGQIWSFEPQRRLFPLLSDNLTINGFGAMAHRHCAALSDHPGTAQLRIFDGYEATATLRPVSSAFIQHTAQETGRNSFETEVPTVRLDDVMRDVSAIDVMKIDIEGHEPAMFRGATEILGRSRDVKIICEFFPAILDPGEALAHLGLIRNLGFSIFRISPDADLTPCPDDDELIGLGFSDLLLLRR